MNKGHELPLMHAVIAVVTALMTAGFVSLMCHPVGTAASTQQLHCPRLTLFATVSCWLAMLLQQLLLRLVLAITAQQTGWLVMQGCLSLTDDGLQCMGHITSLVAVSLQDCTDITGHNPPMLQLANPKSAHTKQQQCVACAAATHQQSHQHHQQCRHFDGPGITLSSAGLKYSWAFDKCVYFASRSGSGFADSSHGLVNL